MAEAPPMRPGGGGLESGGDQSPQSNAREQDWFLPISNIGRIMKKAVPANGKIAKEAKDTVQECVSEFISFVTSEAIDMCQKEKRKMINADDLLLAMKTLGFEEYSELLKVYLARYRELEGFTRATSRGGEGSASMGNQSGPNAEGNTRATARGGEGSASVGNQSGPSAEGNTRATARGGEGSASMGNQSGPSAEFVHQGSPMD